MNHGMMVGDVYRSPLPDRSIEDRGDQGKAGVSVPFYLSALMINLRWMMSWTVAEGDKQDDDDGGGVCCSQHKVCFRKEAMHKPIAKRASSTKPYVVQILALEKVRSALLMRLMSRIGRQSPSRLAVELCLIDGRAIAIPDQRK